MRTERKASCTAADPCRILERVALDITACRRCPRLVAWREKVACDKTRRYFDEDYWGRAVPGFGDPCARLLVIGLAPGAHGANRTGRLFTGDRSGDWLYRALHRAGFASQPTSVRRDDGLVLADCFVTACCRCVPPDNKPLPAEIDTCSDYLDREVEALWPRLCVVVVLGRIAHESWLGALRRRGIAVPRPAPAFSHGAEHRIAGAPVLLCSYHPSQQNTLTRRLTEPMFDSVWARARALLEEPTARRV